MSVLHEIAEQFWRLCRMREFEARGMQPENFDYWFEHGLLSLVTRQMASAERSMHKAVTALRHIQLDRGFVPSKNAQPVVAATPKAHFVRENPPQLEFVPPFFKQDLDESVIEIPDHYSFSPPSLENAACFTRSLKIECFVFPAAHP